MSLEQREPRGDGSARSWRHPLNRFSFGRYRFLFEVTKQLHLPEFAAATLRGGLGYALKKNVCIWPPGDCGRCRYVRNCGYGCLFESRPVPGATKLRNFEQLPRPYLLTFPNGHQRRNSWLPPETEEEIADENASLGRTFREGDWFECEVILIGRAALWFPLLPLAFTRLGRRGLGPERGKFRVAEVRAVCLSGENRGRKYPLVYHWRYGLCGNDLFITTGQEILNQWEEAPRRVTIHFETPTRLEHGEEVCEEITFTDLIRGLLRRLSSLCYFHCGFELQLDYRRLVEESRLVEMTAKEFSWQDQARFSTRQSQRILLGGVVGHATYEAPCREMMATFFPLLAIGQYVHVGKGTVMGLGKFSVRNADWYAGLHGHQAKETKDEGDN
ncbi:MAG: CRISPR system precrRNA processing endoribonuclease RAMP protein Cas6 [Gemmatales bacterium]|nr:CRISPR system precrRNA processing endoribonuclease RAMP protein Cas6 [Gemmatales bacterium]MDW7993487.1 CRISPR system precrRNA processing endoribonuclease RAMP protein Cas6 [Gemmatales bacterium]